MADARESEIVRQAASALLEWPRPFGRFTAIAEAQFNDGVDGVALLDVDGQILRANDRFYGLTGVLPGAVLWDSLPKSAAPLRARLAAGEAAQLSLTLPAPRRVLAFNLLPVTRQGAILRATDQTRVADLEQQLGQSQRLQAVGELAGGIAHDFNNLLTAILGAADDMAERAPAGGQDHADLAIIRQSAQRGAALVRQLLAFSRQQTLQPRVLPLNDQVRATAGLLERLLGTRITLHLSLEEPGRQVRIDPTQLDQVLVNLAVNASHAMPEGGRLTIATGHVLRLRHEAARGELVPPGRYASLTVSDTGHGIPPDILPRIFEPFFTTKRPSGGTGLGLATVHGIVRQSGGYMDVRSTVGQGASFEILLPRHEEAPWQAIAAEPALPTRPIASRTLLLVDDEAPVRALAERMLTRAGWQVIAAPSGEDALELVAAGDLAPALAWVISDVVMPGLDGPALVRTLRLNQPGLPAILMSGYADAPLRQALAAADIRFLAKPFAMKELLDLVQK